MVNALLLNDDNSYFSFPQDLQYHYNERTNINNNLKIDLIHTLDELEDQLYNNRYDILISECILPLDSLYGKLSLAEYKVWLDVLNEGKACAPYILSTIAKSPTPHLPILFYTRQSLQSIADSVLKLEGKEILGTDYSAINHIFINTSYIQKPTLLYYIAKKIEEILENSKNQTK